MSEIERIIDQLKRAMDGEAWHRPALPELLTNISAEQAKQKPLANRTVPGR